MLLTYMKGLKGNSFQNGECHRPNRPYLGPGSKSSPLKLQPNGWRLTNMPIEQASNIVSGSELKLSH